MCTINIDSKQFLQLFIDDYIKKLTLLHYVFGTNYLIIIKYIEPPKKLTIEKFYQCKNFIDNYKIKLNLYFNKNIVHNNLNSIMDIFELYFGGKLEYDKISDILKKIHEPYITQGLIKLNKSYPIIFPRTKIPGRVSFYDLSVVIEFNITKKYFYRLSYNNYNWSLYKIINNTCEILFNYIDIETIIIYLNSTLKKS